MQQYVHITLLCEQGVNFENTFNRVKVNGVTLKEIYAPVINGNNAQATKNTDSMIDGNGYYQFIFYVPYASLIELDLTESPFTVNMETMQFTDAYYISHFLATENTTVKAIFM